MQAIISRRRGKLVDANCTFQTSPARQRDDGRTPAARRQGGVVVIVKKRRLDAEREQGRV